MPVRLHTFCPSSPASLLFHLRFDPVLRFLSTRLHYSLYCLRNYTIYAQVGFRAVVDCSSVTACGLVLIPGHIVSALTYNHEVVVDITQVPHSFRCSLCLHIAPAVRSFSWLLFASVISICSVHTLFFSAQLLFHLAQYMYINICIYNVCRSVVRLGLSFVRVQYAHID